MTVKEHLVKLFLSVPPVPLIVGQRGGKQYFVAEHYADHLIAHGVTVQEWISVKDRLPEDTEEYWIAYKAGGDYYYSTGYFDGKSWCSVLTHHIISVTHWMPLPEPPKGE